MPVQGSVFGISYVCQTRSSQLTRTLASSTKALQTWRGRSCELTGGVFFQASDEDVKDYILELNKIRRCSLPLGWEEQGMHKLLPAILPPGAVGRLGAYEKMFMQETEANGTDTLLCDLNQNPGTKGPRAGLLWPSMLTQHQIFSFGKERLATPGESFAALGLDWYEALSGGRELSQLKEATNGVQPRKLKFMCGNSMHAPSIITFLLFALSHVVRKDDLQQLPHGLPECQDEDEEAAAASSINDFGQRPS